MTRVVTYTEAIEKLRHGAAWPELVEAVGVAIKSPDCSELDLLLALKHGGLVAEQAALSLYAKTGRVIPENRAEIVTSFDAWIDLILGEDKPTTQEHRASAVYMALSRTLIPLTAFCVGLVLARLKRGSRAFLPTKVFCRPRVLSFASGQRSVRIRTREGRTTQSSPGAMTYEDWVDADEIVRALAEDPFAGKPDRNLSFSRECGWHTPFPNLRAAWSESERAVVFYGVHLADVFESWADVFQPSVANDLRGQRGKIVVVVPAIVKMTSEFRKFLEKQQRRLYRDKDGSFSEQSQARAHDASQDIAEDRGSTTGEVSFEDCEVVGNA